MGSPKNRFWGIQYLRAVAAILVAYYHMIAQVPAFVSTLDVPLAHHFYRGVDLFFVISGFVMAVTSAQLTPGEFMKRRLVRIVPLYWILTLALVAVAVVKPVLLKTTHATLPALLQSLLFIPYSNQDGDFEPLLVPGWTLNYEMFFYVVFAFALLWRTRLIAFVGLTLLVVYAACSFADPHAPLAFYANPMIFEFLGGILIGRYYRVLQCPGWIAGLMVVGGFVLLLAPADRSTAMCGAGLIVLGACAAESSMPKIPAWALLGDASYSIYLLHLFVFGVTRAIWHGGAIGYVVFSMTIVLVASILCYQYVEKGFIGLLRHHWKPIASISKDSGAEVCVPKTTF